MFAWLLVPLRTFGLWIAPYVLQFISANLIDWFKRKRLEREEAKKNKEALESFKKALAEKDQDREARKIAEDEFINK